MQLSGKFIDDFKSDRKGISPPLPPYFRLIPIGFYLAIVASIVLNGLFLIRYGQAQQDKQDAIQQNTKVQDDLRNTQAMRKNLEGQAKKASDIAAWISASRPLQPLVVEIARSIEPDASLVDLKLTRDGDNPAQIVLAMRLGAETTRQLDLTLNKIGDQHFRAFSPQQNLVKGEIDYKATLLYQDPSRGQTATPSAQ